MLEKETKKLKETRKMLLQKLNPKLRNFKQ